MQSVQPGAWVVLLAASCFALGMWLASRWRRMRETLRGRAANARGKRGERDAERLLEARGYRICERQARTRYAIEVDGEPQHVDLALDFVVERAGERLVAEVKTGALAPRLARPETRRQLLEYQLSTGCSRVLLVDPEAGTLTEVAFPLALRAQRPYHRITVIAVTIAVLSWWWWSRMQ